MDTDLLLAPLPGNQPGGEDLSFSAAFDEIAHMRRADDPSLNQGEWVAPLKQADWAGVASLCESLLASRSKDLRLALWLTEARALTQGYAGLASGLGLCAALCEQHWDHLHPQPDGGDAEERIGNIAWMLQRLVELSTTLPVTAGRKGQAHTLQDLRRARQAQLQSERAGQASDAEPPSPAQGVTLAQFRRALQETPPEQLRDAVDALRSARAQLQAWQGVVDARLGAEGPSFVAAREALEQAAHELERAAQEVGALSGGTAHTGTGASLTQRPAEAEPTPPGTESTPLAHGTPRPPQTRAEALQQLRWVAAFFRRTEPHSPVAYLADKAIKWGEMPLHHWLAEVVKDPASMAHLQELLGLAAQPDQAEQ